MDNLYFGSGTQDPPFFGTGTLVPALRDLEKQLFFKRLSFCSTFFFALFIDFNFVV